MCKDVPLAAPEKSPHAKEWDGMTLETFKNQTLWTSSMLFICNIAWLSKNEEHVANIDYNNVIAANIVYNYKQRC